MRTYRFLLSMLALALFAAGCLPGAAAQNGDLEEMKRRLAVVEQATVSSQSEMSLDKRLENQARRIADQQAELDALRVELQRLRGDSEDAAHQRQQLHDLLSMIRDEVELKLAQVAQKPVEGASVVQAPSTAPTPATVDPREQYEAALKLIQKENRFSDGRKELQQFLREQPQHELAVNATYWIGEAYYGEKAYDKAILQFQDVIQKFPKHTKAAAAMLKQGLAFGMLGDKATEAALLKKVTVDYPASPEAKKAKELLKK